MAGSVVSVSRRQRCDGAERVLSASSTKARFVGFVSAPSISQIDWRPGTARGGAVIPRSHKTVTTMAAASALPSALTTERP